MNGDLKWDQGRIPGEIGWVWKTNEKFWYESLIKQFGDVLFG